MNKEPIHTFKDNKGVEWIQCHVDQITGDSSVGSKVISFDGYLRPKSDGCDCSLYGKLQLADIVNKDFSILIERSRIELVTEHVEATAMDALQALLASGGNPVSGWRFRYDRRGVDEDDGKLIGVAVSGVQPFESGKAYYSYAFCPVTRVRIKAEVKTINTREVPEGVAPLPEDKPWLAYVGKGDDGDSGGQKPWCYTNTGFSVYSGWDNALGKGYHPLLDRNWHYAIDVRHPEAQERFPEVCKSHDYSDVYGFTLDGNPVPPPPEGWEIVPKGGDVPRGERMVYTFGSGWIINSEPLAVFEYTNGLAVLTEIGAIRAYARRVVNESLTTETVEQAFSKYWQGGCEHRAIDAFRAGAAWAKEVQGE